MTQMTRCLVLFDPAHDLLNKLPGGTTSLAPEVGLCLEQDILQANESVSNGDAL